MNYLFCAASFATGILFGAMIVPINTYRTLYKSDDTLDDKDNY